LVHMGDCGENALSLEEVDFLSGANILMLPAGGVYTIKPIADFTPKLSPMPGAPKKPGQFLPRHTKHNEPVW